MGRTDLMEASAVQARQLVAGSPFAAVADVLLALSRLTAGHQSGALASLLEFGHATERADLVPETAMLVGSVAMALAWADQTVQAQAMLHGIVSRFRTSSMLANFT